MSGGRQIIWTHDYYDNQFSPVIELNLYKIWFIGHHMSNKPGITHYAREVYNFKQNVKHVKVFAKKSD